MAVVVVLAILDGIFLTLVGGWPILAIGVASLLAALLYTGGPFPFGYYGLGDLFVFIFFGLAAVCGTYFVQAGTITAATIVAAVRRSACLITAILVVNNLRDIETDARAGKRTLAVLIGAQNTRRQYLGLTRPCLLHVTLLLWLGFGLRPCRPISLSSASRWPRSRAGLRLSLLQRKGAQFCPGGDSATGSAVQFSAVARDPPLKMADFDIIFVGTGHNSLVCAAYLAKAGYTVGMMERRPVVGGAVVTQEIIPGYHFDLGGSAHILINHTPIVRELSLEQYGLSYIDLDPLFFAPFPDGERLFFWKDIDRTCESIAGISPEDVDNYYRFIRDWEPMAESMVESFLLAPTPLNVAKTLAFQSKVHKDLRRRLPAILGSYGRLLRKTFVSPRVQAVIGWMAAQSGPPPTERVSAPFALWHPMYHHSGVKRPRGGSGMLTQALARRIISLGGTIVTSAAVNQIAVEEGRAIGVRTAEGETYTAGRAVVSGAHIHTTLQLLTGQIPPARLGFGA